MVRGRRTRRVAAATTQNGSATGSPPIASKATNGTTPLSPQNGLKVVSGGSMATKSLMEDFCCASPKRKEYKIDELLVNGNGFTAELQTSPTKTRMVLRGTQQNAQAVSSSLVTSSSATNGRLCPVAGNEITRFLLSQSKSKNRKARKKSPNFELVNDDTCDSFTHVTSTQEGLPEGVGVVKMEDMEEENNEPTHPFQMFGRLPIGNGMGTAEEGNIFLQEPVLKLTVDEAAFELVKPKSEANEEHSGNKDKEVQDAAAAAVAVALMNQDSNSGDSGVVIDKLQDAASANQVTPKPLGNVTRPRVPTTPHRIFCPSSPQLNGANGVKEEGMAVEVEEELSEGQMTNRKLILPTKDEVSEDVVLSNGSGNQGKDETNTRPEDCAHGEVKNESESMKAPKTNGVVAKHGSATGHQSTMEDFFKVRRSVRKTKKEVEREEQLAIEKAILSECDMGLAVKMFENKGRGIVATRPFAKGEFVVEYVGEFISIAEANRREKLYAQDQNTGCYMYYFKHKNKQYCIDATEETGKLGRLVNHSRNGNLMTRTVEVKGQPHLVLIAKEDIEAGRELNYDYGDRSKESLLHHPWLAY